MRRITTPRQAAPSPDEGTLTLTFTQDTEPPLAPVPTTLDEVRPLSLQPVVGKTREGKRWNEFIARYHYLGYKTLVGAQMRYTVHDRDGWPIAMLGFSTAAWKLAPRDRFIGWTPQLREKNLPLVVDNPRFLILPWIAIPNLGSHIFALIRRRLSEDWTERYNTAPVLIETFVENPRFTAPSTRHPAGSVSEPPKGAGATTATSSTTNPRRTSGSGRSEKTGNESSTGDANPRHHPTTERSRARNMWSKVWRSTSNAASTAHSRIWTDEPSNSATNWSRSLKMTENKMSQN